MLHCRQSLWRPEKAWENPGPLSAAMTFGSCLFSACYPFKNFWNSSTKSALPSTDTKGGTDKPTQLKPESTSNSLPTIKLTAPVENKTWDGFNKFNDIPLNKIEEPKQKALSHEETVREKLPDDFQTAEYLEDHGMIDMVIPRNQQHEKLGSILSMLMHKAET